MAPTHKGFRNEMHEIARTSSHLHYIENAFVIENLFKFHQKRISESVFRNRIVTLIRIYQNRFTRALKAFLGPIS